MAKMKFGGRDRLVAYNRETGRYLNYCCLGSTQSRVWAWSGTARQARNMVEQFPAAAGYTLYWDGDEKGGMPADVT